MIQGPPLGDSPYHLPAAATHFSSMAMGGGQATSLRRWCGRAGWSGNTRRRGGCRWRSRRCILVRNTVTSTRSSQWAPASSRIQRTLLEYGVALAFEIVAHHAAGFVQLHAGHLGLAALAGSHPRKEQQIAHAAGVGVKAHRLGGAAGVVGGGSCVRCHRAKATETAGVSAEIPNLKARLVRLLFPIRLPFCS